MKNKKFKWRKYLFEFLTVFFGVSLAFAMGKWNEDKNKHESAEKTLLEIRNGLDLDLKDFEHNILGHEICTDVCNYFRGYLQNDEVAKDSLSKHLGRLLRDFISIQNKSGYESLKSKGLELVKDDSLRLEIISLYDFYYEIIEKLEEQYSENQFNDNYYHPINKILSEYMVFNEEGILVDFLSADGMSKSNKNLLLGYLERIEYNRSFTVKMYNDVVEKVRHLQDNIDKTIAN